MGLQKVGKGDWRGISRNFVKTRTPTQVASHAQKYFLRKSNLNRRRRRSSLFDITADTVPVKPLEEQPKQEHRDETSIIPTGAPAPSVAENSGMNNNNGYGVAPFSVSVGPYYMPVQVQNHPHGNMPVSFVHPVQVPMFTIPSPSPSVINLNERMMMVNPEPSPMSWKLSLSSSSSSKPSSDQSYRAGSYKGGDSFITVS